MDNFARMQAFVAVVEAGGYSAAGRRDGRSKALLSKHVAELEERLGVRLINRTTRTFALTEVGRAYFEEAKEILARVARLEDSVRDSHGEASGQLRVAAPRTLADTVLSPLVMDFLAAHPRISIELCLDDRFVDLVEEGFDVAVRVAELADSSLIARRLAPFCIPVCARPDVAAAARLAHPEDLAGHDCIIDTNTRYRRHWAFRVGGERRSVPVRGRVYADSPFVTREAALAGLGFAKIPAVVVRDDLASGRLVRVLEAFEPGEAAVYALYPHRQHLAGKIRAFVDFLVARLPELTATTAAVAPRGVRAAAICAP